MLRAAAEYARGNKRIMHYGFIKRLVDIVVSFTAIIVLIPLYIVLIIAIRLESSGAAIFKQLRAGKNAHPFTMYKFRTMKTGVDPFGDSPNSGDDPRVTPLGRFLRETSLDELPQLFNVLAGDMSLVGPRPLYVSQIAEWNDYQKRRLEVKPGITGLAQVSGRGSLTIEQKLDLDVSYVDNASILFDLKIILTTLKQVVNRKGIYEVRYSENKHRRGGK